MLTYSGTFSLNAHLLVHLSLGDLITRVLQIKHCTKLQGHWVKAAQAPLKVSLKPEEFLKEILQDMKPTLFQLFSCLNMFSEQSDLSNSLFKSAGETKNNRAKEGFHNERNVHFSPKAIYQLISFISDLSVLHQSCGNLT